MAHRTFKVLDSDIHIIEPPDLSPRYIDPAFRDHGPRLTVLAVGFLPGEPRASAGRRHAPPVRGRRRRGGSPPLREAARLPGNVPAAERGERAELARSLLRAAVVRARGARGPSGVPRGVGLAAPAGRR